MQYEVGDIVLLRPWDDLCKLQDPDPAGDIKIEGLWYFYDEKSYFGKSVRIRTVNAVDKRYIVRSEDNGKKFYVTEAAIEGLYTIVSPAEPSLSFQELFATT